MRETLRKALRVVDANSPTIMSAVAVGGLGTTVYLTVKGTLDAVHRVEEDNRKELTDREVVDLVWDCYLPAAIVGGGTACCIVMATRVGNRRAAAAQAALVISERAYSEYRDKVIDEIGSSQEGNIRDKIAEDRVKNNPPSGTFVVSDGKVLCLEMYTGRYFESDIETIRKSVNDINAQILHHDEATLDDLYILIGLQPTTMSSQFGWTSDKLLEVDFTSMLTPDGRPCLAFGYSYTKNLLAR